MEERDVSRAREESQGNSLIRISNQTFFLFPRTEEESLLILAAKFDYALHRVQSGEKTKISSRLCT